MSRQQVITFWIMIGAIVLSNLIVLNYLPRFTKTEPSHLFSLLTCIIAGLVVLGIFRIFNVRLPSITKLNRNDRDQERRQEDDK